MKLFDPKKIIVPVDLSELSEGIVRAAVEIGELKDAEVHVLHIAKEPNYPSHYGGSDASRFVSPTKIKEDAHARIAIQLDDLARKVSGHPKVKPILIWGEDPAKDIVQISQSGSFDLIVIGTHGRSGMSRFVIGSVAEEVISRAPCFVFVVRAKVVEELLAQSSVNRTTAGG